MKYSGNESIYEVIVREGLLDRTVYLYGTSKVCYRQALELVNNGLDFRGFIEINPLVQGHTWIGKPILSPRSFMDLIDDRSMVVLVSTENGAYDARQQLLELGVDEKLFFEIERNPGVSSEVEVEDAIGSAKRGERLLRENRRGDELLIVHATLCIGDLFLNVCFFREFIKKIRRDKYRFLLTGGGYKVLELYGIKDYTVLSGDEINDVLCYICTVGEVRADAFVIYPELPFARISPMLENRNGMPIGYMYPRYTLGIRDLEKCYEAPCFLHVDGEMIKSEGIKKGETVVLTPRANALLPLPEWFWERLAERLHKVGLVVVTSVVGKETPVRGTQGVFIPIAYLRDYLQYAGFQVGLRSGVCDIISAISGVKQWILYLQSISPKGVVRSNLIWDKMDNCFVKSDLREIECGVDEDSLERIMDRVTSEIEKEIWHDGV